MGNVIFAEKLGGGVGASSWSLAILLLRRSWVDAVRFVDFIPVFLVFTGGEVNLNKYQVSTHTTI